MAWRAIQDTVGQSESLAELSHLAERLYWRLLAHSDPWGRLDARPRKLRARCWPMLGFSDEQAGYALLELERVERIVVYEKGGEYILQVTNFEENQPREAFRKRSGKSRLADPPRGVRPTDGLIASLFRLGANTSQFPGLSGVAPETAAEIPEQVRPRREETEKEKRREEDLAGRQAVVQDPAREPDEPACLPAGEEHDPEPELDPEPSPNGPMAGAVRSELERLRPRGASA